MIMIAISHGRTPKTRDERDTARWAQHRSGPVTGVAPCSVCFQSGAAVRWASSRAGLGRKRQEEKKHPNILAARLISTVDDKECRPGLSANKRDQVTKLGL